MLNRNKTRGLLRFAALCTAISALSAWACSVPVFRYALEHWRADSYQAVVFHRGPLSESQQSLVRDLSVDGLAGQLHANVSVRTVDLDKETKADVLDFWRQLQAESVPWLAVKYPLAVRLPANVWSGPLTAAAVSQVLDSPVRKQVAQRLGRGESAVWVLLEMGDKQKDEAASALVESRLTYLASVLKLPKLEAQDITNGLVSVSDEDLKLEFSLLRLSRGNPAEQAFVKNLLGTEADLEEIQEPIVFPIFGRGRALYALIGKGINHETIDEAASFVIGKCSCQVKDLNPGVDLLLAADWDALLKSQASPASDLPTLPSLAAPAPETVTISGGDRVQSPANPADAGGLTRVPRIFVVSGIVIAGLLAAAAVLLRKR
jgi:hypothetical protein